MTLSTAQYVTEHVSLAGTTLHLLKGGDGPPCLVLHGVEGPEGWLAFHNELAERGHTVFAPSHPGFGQTEAPAWITSVAHQAVFYNWFLRDLGAIDLVGVGLGGWIAATMAVMCESQLRHLVLVGATGLRPEQGEIFDIFVAPWKEVIDRGFFDAQHCAEYQRIYGSQPIVDFGGIREAGRVMSMRMCFKPYMYDPALPAMLRKMRVPTLIVWGTDDRIVPVECASLYQQAIPHARLELLDQCGHLAHLDQPERLAQVVGEFIAG
jgi:pimeloyl-ACP methyl ester carboxylesterase